MSQLWDHFKNLLLYVYPTFHEMEEINFLESVKFKRFVINNGFYKFTIIFPSSYFDALCNTQSNYIDDEESLVRLSNMAYKVEHPDHCIINLLLRLILVNSNMLEYSKDFDMIVDSNTYKMYRVVCVEEKVVLSIL
jgi:hypothetical protein